MQINLYDELKKAIKDALTEWYLENRSSLNQVHSSDENGNNLLTVNQFCAKHKFISEHGLRSKIFNREFNKFDRCMSKTGKRVLIKEKEALEWFSNPPLECNWAYDKKKYASR